MAQITTRPQLESVKPPTTFDPYIKPAENVAEFTLRAIILGAILAIVFGIANAYLGLKVGMTVSASIPAAVISMAILRGLLKKGTVLENNIVQTIGSSGESLAAGVIFTIPAFFIWAATIPDFIFRISNLQIVILSILGGCLGILFMIPLRRYLIVREHGKLPYPEGTACAEILVAGDEGGSKARTVFTGLGLAGLYKALMSGPKLWPENPAWNIGWLKGASLGIDATPALMGVGYIIGPRISALMMSGAALGYLAIAPLIYFVGSHLNVPIPPATVPLTEMSPGDIRNSYIKYIGAGAIAVGGMVSLIKALPVIWTSFRVGLKEIISSQKTINAGRLRTEREIPMSVVLAGSLLVALILWLLPGTQMHLLGALMIVVFGFFFVTVAARIVGIVGSSSSPVSGMTITTLLVTCLIFLSWGIAGYQGMIAAMMVGSVVCLAVCMSGDASQDLKTGFLVGATPVKQQISEFIGVLIPALVMGFVVLYINKAYGFVGPNAFQAPQANVMALVVKGVMTHSLPWIFIIVGIMIGITVELLGISCLPMAIGLYLPLGLSTPIMTGGLIYFLISRLTKPAEVKARTESGILFGSGLVAGDALMGVLIAIVFPMAWYSHFNDTHSEGWWLGSAPPINGEWLSLALFFLVGLAFWFFTRTKRT